MARRRLLSALLLAGSLAGPVLYRRGAAARARRVELTYEDGSVVTLPAGSPGAAALTALAEEILRA